MSAPRSTTIQLVKLISLFSFLSTGIVIQSVIMADLLGLGDVPPRGIDPALAESWIYESQAQDIAPHRNVGSFVNTACSETAQNLTKLNFQKNQACVEEYASISECAERCLAIIGHLWNYEGEDPVAGTATSGSSEAIMLAGLAMKRSWEETSANAGRPNIIFGSNAHVCVFKLANYFNMEARVVSVSEATGFVFDVSKLPSLVDGQTVGIFLTLGSTFTGHYDPVADVSQTLSSYKMSTGRHVPIHVDAASGGLVAPFDHGSSHRPWDFRNSHVQSINTSGHKFGLSSCAVGWLIWRDRSCVPRSLQIESNYLRGTRTDFSLSFSRSTAPIVVQYFNFLVLGSEGYRSKVLALLDSARSFGNLLEGTSHFRCLSPVQRQSSMLAHCKDPCRSCSENCAANQPLSHSHSQAGIPVVVFTFKHDYQTSHPFAAISRLSDWLYERGFSVPHYVLNGWGMNGDDIHVLRVVVREDVVPEMPVLLDLLLEGMAYLEGKGPTGIQLVSFFFGFGDSRSTQHLVYSRFSFGSPSRKKFLVMTFHLNLGAETFSSSSYDLNLALHASAELSTPPGTWNPWSTEESFRKELITGTIWVDQGAYFQLHLYITFDSEPGILLGSNSKFFSWLGDILGKSKFWSELGLEVSFEGPNNILHEQHLPPNPYLSFNFRKSTGKSPASKTSRIPTALQSPCDALRVDMIPTVFLSSITVRLEYTSSGQRARQLLPSCLATETAQTPIPDTTLYNRPVGTFLHYNPPDFSFDPLQIPTDKLQYIEEELEAFQSLISDTEPPPGPGSSPPSCLRELTTLLNTALVTLIVGARKSTRKGLPSEQETQEQHLIPLSRIAPSIFSPGYRDSMNQRAQFIPSVAKSITSIIKHSRDPGLQSNAIGFQCSSQSKPEVEAEISNTHGHDTATVGLKSKLKTSFWRVAANQVLTTQRCRKKKRSVLILVPEVETESEDEPSFEDEILFAATPTDEIRYSLGNEINGDGGDSDRYLGTEDGGSICDGTDAESFETIDNECSDYSGDLIDCHEREIGCVDGSISFSEGLVYHGPQRSCEWQSDDLKHPQSPLLLSDGPIIENNPHEEADEIMLCDNL
ncbi:uncharacterized protein KD926_005404 [Aspergillus affinis]|uniref:uncharacterized protein n=1 Tax=Aspergillus affinis TaxID=1070780 RepID=UPI0022FF0959|nr:uncharacterized protein KD926_005404 [Aspergillus affinis]KAI9042549.1 hypothetical protein KD926_005404 [Aspergillus affinis]